MIIMVTTSIREITVEEATLATESHLEHLVIKNRRFDDEIAMRMATMIAIDPDKAEELRDCVPEGFRIEQGRVFGPEGQVIAVTGNGVDLRAVNRSTAHMVGAAI